MQIIRTTIVEHEQQATVEIVISNHADVALATESMTLKVLVPKDENPLFAAVQRVALQRARDVIGQQIAGAVARSNQ
jgi:hypothetical protein